MSTSNGAKPSTFDDIFSKIKKQGFVPTVVNVPVNDEDGEVAFYLQVERLNPNVLKKADLAAARTRSIERKKIHTNDEGITEQEKNEIISDLAMNSFCHEFFKLVTPYVKSFTENELEEAIEAPLSQNEVKQIFDEMGKSNLNIQLFTINYLGAFKETKEQAEGNEKKLEKVSSQPLQSG